MFTIVTDTSANLPTKVLKQHGIIVVPFAYFIEDEENSCLDTAAFDGETFYNAMREGRKVTTSQITPQKFIDYMEPVLKAGNDILYIGMSSGISGTFNSAEIAAMQLRDEYPDRSIRLVDTLGASLGEGLHVMRAIEYREQGMELEEITKRLLKERHRMYQVFTVDNLQYLRKSGRISNAASMVGTILNIKPLLKGNEEGKIVSFGKVRGRLQSIEAVAKKYAEVVCEAGSQIIGIAHADCVKEAKALAEKLKKLAMPKEIMIVCYEPVTGSHVGPGTLALFFMGREGARSL